MMPPDHQPPEPTYIPVTSSGLGNTTGMLEVFISRGTSSLKLLPSSTFSYADNLPIYSNFLRDRPPNFQTALLEAEKEILQRRHARSLNTAEMNALRRWNREPTLDGIEYCSERHENQGRFSHRKVMRQARYDRRIPCWRAGRWKSLT